MGGNTSKSKKEQTEHTNFDSYFRALNKAKDKYLDTKSNGSIVHTDRLSPNHSPTKPSRLADASWKVHLLSKLKIQRQQEWPKMLSKFVETWNSNNVDAMLQSQFHWLLFNSRSTLDFSEDKTIIFNKSVINSKPCNETNDTVLLKKLDNQIEKAHVNEQRNQFTCSVILETENRFSQEDESSLTKSFVDFKTQSPNSNSPTSPNTRKAEISSPSKGITSRRITLNGYLRNSLDDRSIEMLKIRSMSPTASPLRKKDKSIQDQKIYNLATNLLRKDFQLTNNVFYHVLKIFSDYYLEKYERVLVIIRSKNEILGMEIYNQARSAVIDIQQFARILNESIALFYRLDETSTKEKAFNHDKMFGFITSIVLTEPIYKVTFELLNFTLQAQERIYNNKISVLSHYKPEDVGIRAEFCLNEKTLEHFFGSMKQALNKSSCEQKINKANLNENLEEFAIVETEVPENCDKAAEHQTSDNIKLEKQALFQKEGDETSKRTGLSDECKEMLKHPYDECIKALKAIEDSHNPLDKIDAIISTVKLIKKSIKKFYHSFKINKTFDLESDVIVSIMAYIVMKSEIKNLHTHIRIVEHFTANDPLDSVSGSCLTCLEDSVKYIINMQIPNDTSEDLSNLSGNGSMKHNNI